MAIPGPTLRLLPRSSLNGYGILRNSNIIIRESKPGFLNQTSVKHQAGLQYHFASFFLFRVIPVNGMTCFSCFICPISYHCPFSLMVMAYPIFSYGYQ